MRVYRYRCPVCGRVFHRTTSPAFCAGTDEHPHPVAGVEKVKTSS